MLRMRKQQKHFTHPERLCLVELYEYVQIHLVETDVLDRIQHVLARKMLIAPHFLNLDQPLLLQFNWDTSNLQDSFSFNVLFVYVKGGRTPVVSRGDGPVFLDFGPAVKRFLREDRLGIHTYCVLPDGLVEEGSEFYVEFVVVVGGERTLVVESAVKHFDIRSLFPL